MSGNATQRRWCSGVELMCLSSECGFLEWSVEVVLGSETVRNGCMTTQDGADVCVFEACWSPSIEMVTRSTGLNVPPKHSWSDSGALGSGMLMCRCTPESISTCVNKINPVFISGYIVYINYDAWNVPVNINDTSRWLRLDCWRIMAFEIDGGRHPRSYHGSLRWQQISVWAHQR